MNLHGVTKRFCGECSLNVYNLSGMTRDEAENLIQNAEGRLCVRFYQRADGTVITEDCPVGWAKVKKRTKMIVTAVGSLLIALFSGVLFVSLFSKNGSSVGKIVIPFVTPTPQVTMGTMPAPRPEREAEPKPTMGKIAIRPNGDRN